MNQLRDREKAWFWRWQNLVLGGAALSALRLGLVFIRGFSRRGNNLDFLSSAETLTCDSAYHRKGADRSALSSTKFSNYYFTVRWTVCVWVRNASVAVTVTVYVPSAVGVRMFIRVEPDFVESAWATAVILKLAGFGTDAGAL